MYLLNLQERKGNSLPEVISILTGNLNTILDYYIKNYLVMLRKEEGGNSLLEIIAVFTGNLNTTNRLIMFLHNCFYSVYFKKTDPYPYILRT